MKWFAILLFSICTLSQAQIYTWTDENGRVHYGDKPTDDVNAKTVNIEVNSYTNVTYEFTDFYVPNREGRSHNPKVIMYSTSWCGYCKKARNYFHENNISYVEYDIEKDEKAHQQYKNMGATGVPVILVGKRRMNGFNAAGFEKMLN